MKPKVKKILLSIKPKFVDEIQKGTKKFEYRKKIFKDQNVEIVVIYSSAPVSKAVGEFKIKQILKDAPEELWNLTHVNSGIEKDYFNTYFKNREYGYAIEISDLIFYKEPINIKETFQLTPPQSFCYFEN